MSSRKLNRRLLIVAYESCGPEELSCRARERADPDTTIQFVAPVRLARAWERDEGDARRSAVEKLGEVVASLRREGLTAAARVGSADPVAAIDEALADFPADEILMFTGPDQDSWWLHKTMLERAHERFRLQIVQVVINPPRRLAEVA
jgi:ABC-type nitrate/sulfonate/bicarbonate transport system substrate-binding protein